MELVNSVEPDDDGEFILEPTVFKLMWSDGDLKGLVVRVRSLPIGTLLTLSSQIDLLQKVKVEDLVGERLVELMRPLRAIAGFMVSWNLKIRVGGVVTPVACTFDGLMEQEATTIKAILLAWWEASGSATDPLGLPSSTSPQDDELMATLGMMPPPGS